MNLRFIDWIWHVRGSLALKPGQSSDDAFDRLGPLFGHSGTSHQRTNNVLIFRKKDQAAQDKMSVFDSGSLRVTAEVAGPLLSYDLTSRALLFCFLAPLLFLSLGQVTIAVNKLEKPSHEAAKKHVARPLNPIDRALGAPAPDNPEKSKKVKSESDDEKLKPTAAYVLAGLFATLYVVGRVLEDRLAKAIFIKSLLTV